MKRNIYLMLIIGWFILGSTLSAANCERPLRVGWEYWPPYQYLNNQQELVGLDVELLKATAAEAGCTVKFLEVPWKRHLLLIENGHLDIAMGASFEKSRAKYAYFSTPVRAERVSLFVLESKANQYKIQKLKDIMQTDFVLGATLGYYYGKEYRKLMQTAAFRAHVEEMHTDKLNYIKLFHGRINGFLADPISMPHQLSSLTEKQALSSLFDVYSTDVHFMFSKKSIKQSIFVHLNRALDGLKSSQTYTSIMNSYLEQKATINSTLDEVPLLSSTNYSP